MLMIIFILILMNNNYGQHTINTTNVNDGTNRAINTAVIENQVYSTVYIVYIDLYA